MCRQRLFGPAGDVEARPLRPSLLESMGSEANEELFVVSAVGVLVDADETVLVASRWTSKPRYTMPRTGP